MNIRLRKATENDKINIYRWLFFSDSSQQLNQWSGFYQHNIPTMDEFYNEDFPAYFFNGKHPEFGMCFIIVRNTNSNNEDIGTVCYSAFHLKKGIAEIDIWMRGKDYCGKGYGTEAIKQLVDIIGKEGFRTAIVSLSDKNFPAIKAFAKAGFISTLPERDKYYKIEQNRKYGHGVYREGTDVFMQLMI
jgi:RimJ/RimL family protein N-acetyltransferase